MSIDDDRAHRILVANLATLNKRIAAYLLRALDADAQRTSPTPPADERSLGDHLVELGHALQARAAHRPPEPAMVIDPDPVRVQQSASASAQP
jgi:hypothetical protein